jgi:hypothetical protein
MHCREEEEIVDYLDLQTRAAAAVGAGIDIQLRPHLVELAMRWFPRRQEAHRLMPQKYV